MTRRKQTGSKEQTPPTPTIHWAVMGKLKIAFFTTRDDSRVAQLGPASGRQEAGSGGEEMKRRPQGYGRSKGILIKRAVICTILEQSRKCQRCISDDALNLPKTDS